MLDALPANAREITYWLVALSVMVFACVLGGRSERLGAGLVLANFVASAALQFIQIGSVKPGVWLADTLLLLALFAIALRVARWWPRAAAGFAVLALLSHFGALVERPSEAWHWAYVTWQWMTSAGILLSIAAGGAEAPFARKYERWAAGT